MAQEDLDYRDFEIGIAFFFDSIPPEEADVPGSGPWQIYPTGPGKPNTSPFTLYTVDQRPEGVTQMCILVASDDHGVNQGTGNCVDLPYVHSN